MKIVWDEVGKRYYETGVSNCVLYVQNDLGQYPKGVAWNGVTSISESPSGAEASPFWADNIKYLNLMSEEEFGATIEAYTYPDEFEECDGFKSIATGVTVGQQTRKSFGLCYKTILGNDIKNNDYGYKLHFIYGAKASPSEKSRSTVNENPDIMQMSWTLTTTPVPVKDSKPTAYLTVTSTTVPPAKLKSLEEIIYGKDEPTQDARLPLPDEIATLIGAAG